MMSGFKNIQLWEAQGQRNGQLTIRIAQNRKNEETAVYTLSNKEIENAIPCDEEQLNCEFFSIIMKGQLNQVDYYGTELGRTMTDNFENLIKTYMDGNPWIPYDMEERRKKFPKAFEELKYYIDRIIADREKERGAQNA